MKKYDYDNPPKMKLATLPAEAPRPKIAPLALENQAPEMKRTTLPAETARPTLNQVSKKSETTPIAVMKPVTLPTEEKLRSLTSRISLPPLKPFPTATISRSHTPEESLEVMAHLGRRDLLFFMRNILGYDWINETEHRELCDFLMNKKRSRFAVVAAPRDTLKTTVCSQGYPLWKMIRGEVNLRVLLDAENRDKSKNRLQAIQQKLETSIFFKRCYGDWNGKSKGYKWNEEEATISVRKNSSIREPTFDTAGVDVVKNSMHYDMIIPDDCHSDKNTKEKSQIQKVVDHYRVLQPMLEPGGEFLVVCTWWDDKDANRDFIEMMGDDVSVFMRTAYLDADQTLPRYPKRLPIPTLALRRKIMGERMFSLQYLLECVATEDALFREEDIRIVPRDDVPPNLRKYLLVDPAGDPTSKSEEKRDSDNYAIGVLAVSPTGSVYLIDLAWGVFSPTEGVEEIIKLVVAHNPHVVGIEKTGLGNTSHYVKEALRQMGRYAIVENLLPAGRSKTERVSGLDPLVRLGKFHIVADLPHRPEAVNEFVRFTRHGSKAKFDDIVDMCAYVVDMLRKYGTALDDSVENLELNRAEQLMYLNPSSREHWEDFHRVRDQTNEESWNEEFLA